MRLKEWRHLRFGPAVIYDVPDENSANIHLWSESLDDPVHEGLVAVAMNELPQTLRSRGVRMWVVQTPLFDGNYRTIDYVPRHEGEGWHCLDSFVRRWRRIHRRWWELWKWNTWLPANA
ncbi:MAG: hypothetical protein QOE14_1692 [Humisphaera sp.]|nr:hypothetical protein [Humisphaera sp.]